MNGRVAEPGASMLPALRQGYRIWARRKGRSFDKLGTDGFPYAIARGLRERPDSRCVLSPADSKKGSAIALPFLLGGLVAWLQAKLKRTDWRWRRRIAMPMPPMPRIIRPQVAGSGMTPVE